MCVDIRLVADRLYHAVALFLWLFQKFPFSCPFRWLLHGDRQQECPHGWEAGLAVITQWLQASLQPCIARMLKKKKQKTFPQEQPRSSVQQQTKCCHFGELCFEASTRADGTPEGRQISLNCLCFPRTPTFQREKNWNSFPCPFSNCVCAPWLPARLSDVTTGWVIKMDAAGTFSSGNLILTVFATSLSLQWQGKPGGYNTGILDPLDPSRGIHFLLHWSTRMGWKLYYSSINAQALMFCHFSPPCPMLLEAICRKSASLGSQQLCPSLWQSCTLFVTAFAAILHRKANCSLVPRAQSAIKTQDL